MRIKFGLLITIIVATIFTGAVPAHFAKAITMSPVRMEIAVDPGAQYNGVIKIYNDEPKEKTLYLSIEKFTYKDESGDPSFLAGQTDELVAWTSITPSVVVPSHEFKEVPFTINVPTGVEPGGYFGAVFASIIPPVPGGSEVSLENHLGTLLLLRVNGDFPKVDTLREFDTKNHQHWFSNVPVELYFRFSNAGADRSQPLGDIEIKNIFGNTTKIIPANRGAGNVLPQSTRLFEVAWVTTGGDKTEAHAGPAEQPKFDGFWSHVQYEWHHFAFGRYTANLELTVGNDSSRKFTEKTVFYVIPWHLFAIIAAGIAAERLLGWLWRARKRVFRRKKNNDTV